MVSIAWALTGCASGTYTTLDVGGVKRNYYLVAPPGLEGPAPVVLVFHGGGPGGSRKGRRMGAMTGFADLAHEEGFIAAFPSSWAGNWADGREVPLPPPDAADDLLFVDALLDDLASKHAVDASRVYATGISNGGFFTNHLACRRTRRFAAYGNVVGGHPTDYACSPDGPAPMLLMPGTADPLVPYEGGAVASTDGELAGRGALIPQAQNQAFWIANNGCAGPAETETLPDRTPDDGSTVRTERFTGCAEGSEVLSVILDGGGHGWPGGSQYLPSSVIGPVNQDIDAERTLWAFFQRHARAPR